MTHSLLSSSAIHSDHSSRHLLLNSFHSPQTPTIPSIFDLGLPPLHQTAFTNLTSDDPRMIHVVLCQFPMLYFPHIIAPLPSELQLSQILAFQSSPDPMISIAATELLLFLFATLPETQPFLSQTAFYSPALAYLSSRGIVFRLLDVLKCSPPILRILDAAGLTPRLLAHLRASADDNYFAVALSLYDFLLASAIPSAVAASPSVVAALACVALDGASARQWAVLRFLRTALRFCGDQLIDSGAIRAIVANCVEFGDARRSLALQLLADFAAAGFAEQLVRFGAIALMRRAIAFCADGSARAVPLMELMRGIAASGVENARMIARAFAGGEIADVLANGDYEEKIAAADVVLAMFEYVVDGEIARYLAAMPLVSQIADMLESQFRHARRAILGVLLCLKAAHERGVLYGPLKEQFELVVGDGECVAAIEAIASAEDCEPEVRDMAGALLTVDCE